MYLIAWLKDVSVTNPPDDTYSLAKRLMIHEQSLQDKRCRQSYR